MKNVWIIIWLLCFALPLRRSSAAPMENGFDEFKIISFNGAKGDLSVSNGTFHLSNSAAAENGKSFALKPFSGSGQIIARIRRPTDATGKAGLIFRETTNASSRYAGIFFDKGDVVFERVASTNEPPILTVQTNANAEWLRVTREGTTVNGFFSCDGTNWTQLSADTVEMPDKIFAGLAMEKTGEADFENVRMTSAHWLSPLPNTEFKAPVNILLKLDVASLGSETNRVEFFHGARKIGERNVFPYEMTWSNALAGPDLIFAKVTDETGAEFFTKPIHTEIKLPPTQVKFIGEDSATQGNWKGVYGAEGFAIPRNQTNLLPFVQWDFSMFRDHVWGNETRDKRALVRTDSRKRIASTWYFPRKWEMEFTFADGNPHRFTMYFLDWDRLGRVALIEVINPMNQKVLDSRTISSYSNGKYLSWSIVGRVKIRITPIKVNALIVGLFFDPEPGKK